MKKQRPGGQLGACARFLLALDVQNAYDERFFSLAVAVLQITAQIFTEADFVSLMPRLTILRLLKSVILLWLSLLGFWLFLPFPPHDPTVQNTLVQQTLQSGHPLNTVHEYHESFLAPRDASQWPRSGCDQAVILDWRLTSDPNHDSITLQLGESFSLNLTEIVVQDMLHRDESRLSKAEHPLVTWTDDLSIRVRTAAPGQIYDPWWFYYPDAVLLNEQLWAGDYCDIDLKVLVTDGNQVEVFKASTFYSYDDMGDKYYARIPPITTARPVRVRERGQGHLATFFNIPTGFKTRDDAYYKFRTGIRKPMAKTRGDTSNIGVSNFAGSLPSKTYPIRRVLMMIVAPILLIIHIVGDQLLRFHFLLPVILGAYALLMTLAWLVAGKPRPVWSWLRGGNWWLFGDSNARRRKGRFDIPYADTRRD